MFAMGDRPPWTNRRPPDASGVPTLQQMFALARRMGYEMRPIARQTDAPRQQPGSRPPVDQNRRFRSQPRTGHDYSRIKCFSCGQYGHMQSRCPQPDASLTFKPAGWFLHRMVANRKTAIIKRETLLRPGPHPHRSARPSFDPYSIYMH